MTSGRTLLVVSLATAATLVPDTALAQCPMCRLALESPDAQGLAAAFRSGILFLLAAPFVVFGTIATLAVRASRRHGSGGKAAAPSRGAESPALQGGTELRCGAEQATERR